MRRIYSRGETLSRLSSGKWSEKSTDSRQVPGIKVFLGVLFSSTSQPYKPALYVWLTSKIVYPILKSLPVNKFSKPWIGTRDRYETKFEVVR